MKRIVGLCLTSLGGLVILYFFSSFTGVIANLLDSNFQGGIQESTIYDGVLLVGGFTAFALGWKILKREIGIVFISLGSIGLITSGLGVVREFVRIGEPFQTPYSIGQFAGNCFLLLSSVVLISAGISSFSKKRNTEVIDDGG